ncbi:glucosaminidase domain-containing protein [Agathobaculum sp.]|uniref:glucosaminidase domain-containing protein n=1 Tax=Agathobaculum sp. TaxID=2048138 RepID=UPI002A7FF231|nr:glucosaminidase domain-containing protein [Agathobaculum sp.]MDY3617748.1 glucosaminidase domain-containing protein [Agathobaculum sp.]
MKRLILALGLVLALPAAASAVPAAPASAGGQTVYISTTEADTTGTRADPTIYNIEGKTYFKLRDLGRLLDFGVTYDASDKSVHILPDKPYTPTANESTTNTATERAEAVPTKQTLYLNDKRITPAVYNIKGNNYLGLRELGELVDFGVAYNYDTRRITVYGAYPYASETSWSAAMNDLAINLSVLPAASYPAAAERHAPAVTGEKAAGWRELVSTLRAVKSAPPFTEGPNMLYRANLYWADRLTAAMTHSAVSTTPRLDGKLAGLADADLFDNPDKTALEQDFTALSAAYLGTSPKSASDVAVTNGFSKDARARFSLADEYAAAHGAADGELAAAKQHFSADMAALSALSTDRERVSRIAYLLKSNFRAGGGAFWTAAWQSGAAMDSFSFACAADWMFWEAGIPSFIARSYNKAWNVVYVDQTWSVFEASKGDTLYSLEAYLPDDTHPGSTILLTQVMRPGSSYADSKSSPVDRYFTYHPIAGASVATAEQMRAYIKAVNPEVAQSVLDMIPYYLSEGEAEGIRGDLAFAQSCLETGNFRFEGSAVTLEQNNFCGLGVTSNGMTGAAFDTPQLGIRAQIQHLKAYASRQPLKNECIDPRFSLVTRGCAEYLEHLGMQENPKGYGWAAGADYGVKILNILDYILSYPAA